MKKKNIIFLMSAVAVMTIMFSGCSSAKSNASSTETKNEQKTFAPSKNIEWVVASTAGSSADVFSRITADVVKNNELCSKPIIINNQADGSGAVAWRKVSALKGNDADTTLLTYNIGDVPSMLQNTNITIDDFKVIGVLAEDSKFIYVTKNSKYKTFEDLTNALKNGEKIVLGGGKADDNVMYALLKKAIDPNNNLSYMQNGDTAKTAVAALGGHVSVAIGKPSACLSYIQSGEFFPIVIEGKKRLGPPFENTPTFTELGYDNVDFIQARAIFASKNMSDEAYSYWQDVFSKAAKTSDFTKNYIEKYQSQPSDIYGSDAQQFFKKAQQDCIDSGLVNK